MEEIKKRKSTSPCLTLLHYFNKDRIKIVYYPALHYTENAREVLFRRLNSLMTLFCCCERGCLRGLRPLMGTTFTQKTARHDVWWSGGGSSWGISQPFSKTLTACLQLKSNGMTYESVSTGGSVDGAGGLCSYNLPFSKLFLVELLLLIIIAFLCE